MAKSSKGSQWERDICKYLSKWIQGTEKPYLFWRGRGSGSVFTRNKFTGESFAGDIYPVGEEGRIITDYVTIECKNGYPKTSLDNHLKYNKSDILRDFWEQTTNDAIKTDKMPILVYKKKSMHPWIGINQKLFNVFNDLLEQKRYINIHYRGLEDMVLVSFDDFFTSITCDIWTKRITGV